MDILLSLLIDLIFELTNLTLNAASRFDQLHELTELGVNVDEQFVGLLRVFVFFGGLKGKF